MKRWSAKEAGCDLALASLSGVLIAASMPKVSMWILGWVALVPFFHAISDKSPLRSMLLGWLMGFAAYLGILYWVVYSQVVYGGVPPVGALASMFLLVAVCALYPAIFGLAMALATGSGRGWGMVSAAPCIWVTQEYVLSMFPLGGFPWQLLGYSQVPFLPAIQIADITGIYGVSFMVVMVNACFIRLLKRPLGWHQEVIAVGIILALCLGYGVVQLQRFPSDESSAPQKVRTLMVQGNIDQGVKWDERFRLQTMEIYRDMSLKNGKEADLIIWPETALPLYYQSNEKYRPMVQEVARRTGAYLLFGSLGWDQKGGEERYFNSAFLLAADGRTVGRYDKVHLVPYGEYIPMRRWMPFLNPIVQSVGDFTPGERIAPVDSPLGKIGVLICFESIFPELSRKMVRQGAWLLVNLTNDAWHGRTSEPYQHMSMSQVRSVENRRPTARSTNTGISAFVDEAGRVQETLGLFQRGVLTRSITPSLQELSFYTRFGDVFAILCLILSGLMVVPLRRPWRL